jgi:prenyltransferase beta subunit
VVVSLPSAAIPDRGGEIESLLASFGVHTELTTVSDTLSDPEVIESAQVVVLDASLGSEDGSSVPSEFVTLLLRHDIPVVLVGRAAWLLHRLRGLGFPSQTASINTLLQISEGHEGAVFLSSPESLTLGASLTSETGMLLPNDVVQIERSRLEDLTGRGESGQLAPLRYDAWPLDTFLFGPEDPSLLTNDGRGLMLNTIAYATAIGESPTSQMLINSQTPNGELLAGGFHYQHESMTEFTYYAVHSMRSVLDATAMTQWRTDHQSKVQSILSSLYVETGSDACFIDSASEGKVSLKATAWGLWLVEVMCLSSQFTVSKLVANLSSGQDVSGGFNDDMTATFHVTEALFEAGELSAINTGTLESWLRDCVVTGGDAPSNPEYWGGVSKNPSSIISRNSYSAQYVLALEMLGESHHDPNKLTEWINEDTSNGDGSFNDVVGQSFETVTGTSSALTTLSVLGTLSIPNRTAGLAWLSSNQLDSGGFGMRDRALDIVAKSRETERVALCLEELEETSGSLSNGISDYFTLVETDMGFETMEPIPTLMWSYWVTDIARLTHSTIDHEQAIGYLESFDEWRMYPFWSNMTTYAGAEYKSTQYRTKSVWSQFFGIGLAKSLSVQLSAGMVSGTSNYISQAQDSSGHYRNAPLSGSPHMQYSVAAIEALYLIDELDTITYRTQLESALLSEYSSGQWSIDGWALMPFAGQQSAIDQLCTRAAFRLGLIDATMASEIASNIKARIQYADLGALSHDVATLSLLNSSFSISVSSIDRDIVLSALGSSSFPDGWFNSTDLWQPALTAGVLEMISSLGLRTLLYDTSGGSISATVQSMPEVGQILSLDVAITSSLTTHTVYVQSFDEWMRFDNVANTDTLEVPVPNDESALGPANASVMLWDWGASRAFDGITTQVAGTLQGTLDLETPIVFLNERVNGTVTWSLTSGADAGLTEIVIRLGDPPTYQEWTYDDVSPFHFSVPTTGFDTGMQNLTVTLNREYCDALVLRDEVVIASPDPTYMLAPAALSGDVGQVMDIDWSLHFLENDSLIPGQLMSLEVRDDTESIIHTDSAISTTSPGQFHWMPLTRGVFAFKVLFERNGTLQSSEALGLADVFESTVLEWIDAGTFDQHTTVLVSVQLRTGAGEPLAGQPVHITITAPSSTVLLDATFMTNSSGHVQVTFTLNENGVYSLEASFAGQGFLKATQTTDGLVSWSDSVLTLSGVPSEGLTEESWTFWALLEDVTPLPLEGEPVIMRVILLPSTVVFEQTLTTNATGHASATWSTSTAGSYLVEAEYEGTISRQAQFDSSPLDVRISVSLGIEISSDPEVSVPGWVGIYAEESWGSPIVGLVVMLVIRDPADVVVFEQTALTGGSGYANFSWTPSVRGLNTIAATSDRQAWFEASEVNTTAGVMEQPVITIDIDELLAPSNSLLTVSVIDSSLAGVSGVTVRTIVTLNDATILDVTNVTAGDGTVILNLQLTEPGNLSIAVGMSEQGWLLAQTNGTAHAIHGLTQISVSAHPQPVDQGTTYPIKATLIGWDGQPMIGALVTISVSWANGISVDSATLSTGIDGTCTLGHIFNSVGDFILNATYVGTGLNCTAMDTKVQRVRVTPSLTLTHDPTSLLGDDVQFLCGVYDAFGQYVTGRTLTLSIMMNSVLVFEIQFISGSELSMVLWTPAERGLATITLTHTGDAFYLDNSTVSTMSVLEHVSGTLEIDPTPIDVFQTTTLTYTLGSTTGLWGIEIVFEVLGIDLVPVWTESAFTNISGVVEVQYIADDLHGILMAQAGPSEDQFLVGGDVQEQLVVMTQCHTTTEFTPPPASVGSAMNITINAVDDLGEVIDGLSIQVTLFDPYGQPVKLGLWSNHITITLEDGAAYAEFTPEYSGLHTVFLDSSGSVSVHSFHHESFHTVHTPTFLDFLDTPSEMEVGESFDVSVLLSDYAGQPLIGMDVTILLEGPGGATIGPVDLKTDENGLVFWNAVLDDAGPWQLTAQFDGLGVYLATQAVHDIDVRVATVVEVVLLDTGDIIAGVTPACTTVLLTDSQGTPLEGQTIRYEVYHEAYGLVESGSFIQFGHNPESFNITLVRGGNHTLVFVFDGTETYHSSTAAGNVWVLGTSGIYVTGPTSVDKSNDSELVIAVMDELNSRLVLAELDLLITMDGPDGAVNLTALADWQEFEVHIPLWALPVGAYTLDIAVLESSIRLGDAFLHMLNMTAETTLTTEVEELSGLVGHLHSITLMLTDTLGDGVDAVDVWISLFAPDGREISWNPSMTGNYTLEVWFEGDDFRGASWFTVIVLTRRATVLEVNLPDAVTFPAEPQLILSLKSGFAKLADADVHLTIMLGNETIWTTVLETDFSGRALIDIESLLAGEYMALLFYLGSEVYAPNNAFAELRVLPSVAVAAISVTDAYIGFNCSVVLGVVVQGVPENWQGTMQVTVSDTDGSIIAVTETITSGSELSLLFVPELGGVHGLNFTISGLPVITNFTDGFSFSVVDAPLALKLDLGLGPLLGGGGIIGLIGILVRKKLGAMMDNLPTEWEST